MSTHRCRALRQFTLRQASARACLTVDECVRRVAVPHNQLFQQVAVVASILPNSPYGHADLEYNARRAALPVRAERAAADLYLGAIADVPDLIVADPPRTGLGKSVVRELLRLRSPRMVIVSCDPATLGRDLAPLLAAGYRIERLSMVDLFPQTYHIEAVVDLAL